MITLKAVAQMWEDFKSIFVPGPTLSELLPDTAAECRARILAIEAHPRYSNDQKAWAIMLLDARAKALQRRESGLPQEIADSFYGAPGMHIKVEDAGPVDKQDEALKIAYEEFDADPDAEANLRAQIQHEERIQQKIITGLGHMPPPPPTITFRDC